MQTAPYGTWPSPITAADVAAGDALVEWVDFVGEEVWWVETRPGEGGRSALVRRAADGSVTDVLGPGWNARTRVIEYGGRPWLGLGAGPRDGFVFTHWDDQRVYRAAPGEQPTPLSPPAQPPYGLHYCDFTRVGDEVWCLRERIADPAGTQARRDLVALPLDGSAAGDPAAVRVLAASHHFMTGPKVAPDGRHVAWIGWDHPAMPWESTEVMLAPVGPDGTVGPARRLLGGDGVSTGQIDWAPDRPETLYALSDPGGWWNIHEVTLDGRVVARCPREEEFGEALWRIGARWFLPLTGGRLVVVHGLGRRELAVLDAGDNLHDIGGPYTEWAAVATDGARVAGTAASPRHPRCVVLAEPTGSPAGATAGTAPGAAAQYRRTTLRRAEATHPAYLPTGERRTFTGAGGEPVHAFVYPPANPQYTGPDGERPPYLVHVHGGPTSRSQLIVNEEIAYFTSRGFGVVDVQYGGSTGFGRAYRERLRGNWGLVDVQDCATAIRALIAEGVADPERIAIRGGSAGGWTAVASLGAEPELYHAGAISFPVLDAVQWRTAGTHDFESQYLDSLIGPWPAARERYVAHSPIGHAGAIRAPLLLMQGLEDAVCPPAQAELLLDRLRGRGVPHHYLTFAGEQHGFRREATIVTCLEAELALYAQVFGLDRPDVRALELRADAALEGRRA